MAGHSSFQITMDRYGHLFPGQGRDLAKALDELAHSWPYDDSDVISLDSARQKRAVNQGE